MSGGVRRVVAADGSARQMIIKLRREHYRMLEQIAKRNGCTPTQTAQGLLVDLLLEDDREHWPQRKMAGHG